MGGSSALGPACARADNKLVAQEASLNEAFKFARKHARRYRHDRLLSPRTLFKEVYDKPLAIVTAGECFLVETSSPNANASGGWRRKPLSVCSATGECAKLGIRETQSVSFTKSSTWLTGGALTISKLQRCLREGRKSMEAEAERVAGERAG